MISKKAYRDLFAKLSEENRLLHEIIEDIHWMARRYADGRHTFSASVYNACVRKMQTLGIPLRPDPMDQGTIWAKDGDGRSCDGLTEEEATKDYRKDYDEIF